MILRLPEYRYFNPIRAHLRVSVIDCRESERVLQVLEHLRRNGFDHRISRALVFVSTRRGCETLAAAIEDLLPQATPYRVGYFHAGLDGDEREASYRAFQSGEVAILCATKAFGMGMDIPNIHFICHYDAPSALEDYIQEVGRGGRDAGMLARAGFSAERPINCLLFANHDDFNRIRDKIHKSQLGWAELTLLQQILHRYLQRFRKLEPNPARAVPLPLDLVLRAPEFRDKADLLNRQRLGLYWLEELGRIRLGNYLPAFLEFANRPAPAGGDLPPEVAALSAAVQQARSNFPPDAECILVSSAALFEKTGAGDFGALFRIIARAQRFGAVTLYRRLAIEITQSRFAEVEYRRAKRSAAPLLSAGYAFVRRVLGSLAPGQAGIIDNDFLEAAIREVIAGFFRRQDWDWVAPDGTEAQRQKADQRFEKDKADFSKPSRRKVLFRLCASLPGMFVKTEIKAREVTRILRNENPAWQQWLERHQALAEKLLHYLHQRQLSGEGLELVPLLLDLEVPDYDIDFLENVLLFLRGMGYIHYHGPLLPTAVELYLLSAEALADEDRAHPDHPVFRRFQETRRLKLLRLAALETLSLQRSPQDQNRFIEAYFQCHSADEVFALIEDFLPREHELLKSLQGEALQHEVEGEAEEGQESPRGGLSADQQAIYRSSFRRSTVVIAGPGSGKTHTLLLRLARLVHEENADPRSILVIAYNRAVVAELKHRLQELFARLGYRHLIKSLKVFTFHGLVRFCLPEQVRNLPLQEGRGRDPWIEAFLAAQQAEPGRIALRLGNIQHVFVDEFQDITGRRYEMLRALALPGKAAVTVIGDPNQSIYGYERAAAGENRAAEPYFKRFAEDYDAQEYRILDNFRSYEQIIRRAEALIRPNAGRILVEPLQPRQSPRPGWALQERYAETAPSAPGLLLEKLRELLREKNDAGRPYREVALLCRTNQEVYRILGMLRQAPDLSRIPLRVQGDGAPLIRQREVAHFRDRLRDRAGEVIPGGALARLIGQIRAREGLPAAWSGELLEMLIMLLREFESTRAERARYGDLLDFLEEITRADDGQIYKLFQLWQAKEVPDGQAPTRIVLSTIHKVKGLEFDAVILPASYAELPFDGADGASTEAALFDEERRIFYVALTRARQRLLWLTWRREEALGEGRPFTLPGVYRQMLGSGFGSGIDNVIIYKCAHGGFIRYDGKFPDEAAYFRYLHQTVQIGDPLTLERNDAGRWLVRHRGRAIAALSSSSAQKLSTGEKIYRGLQVTGIVRYYYDEALRFDQKHRTDFAQKWSPFFREMGFAYVVDFSGYGRGGG